jgi:chromodomain-helicase-DNA-binding protein 7
MIRDKFPFEPEREEDGSLLIEKILGRRPRKEGGHRWVTSLNDRGALDAKYEYEYLLKYKCLSYLHVGWLTANEIDAMNLKNKQCLMRYLNKLNKSDPNADESGEIESSYLEIERIMDFREEEVTEIVEDAPPLEPVAVNKTNNDDDDDDNDNEDEVDEKTAKKSYSSRLTRRAANTEVDDSEDLSDTKFKSTSQTQITYAFAERCNQVLLRIWDDPYASSFVDPVDTDAYDDYLDIVDRCVCLEDVRKKLDAGDYSRVVDQKDFAGDMRVIWRNCKRYNLYKSQIWYAAHCLSMLFERLYQGWVISFQSSPLSIEDDQGQPWFQSCRVCQEDHDDTKIMLCDHCDAAFHIYCLTPPLNKVPEGAWMCDRCKDWFTKMTGSSVKMYSATAEDEMRAYSEGSRGLQVVRVRKKKYLVKWRGLSYKDSTWETKEDIDDEMKIAEYHKVNDIPPDEPLLTEGEIGIELAKDRKEQIIPAFSDPNAVKDLDATVYAQIRAYHFLKHKKLAPNALLNECGVSAAAYVKGMRISMLFNKDSKDIVEAQMLLKPKSETIKKNDEITVDMHDESKHEIPVDMPVDVSSMEVENNKEEINNTKKVINKELYWVEPNGIDIVRNEVSECLSSLVYSCARNLRQNPYPSRPRLPRRDQQPSEIEVCVEKGASSLLMAVGKYKNHVIITGFKKDSNGFAGSAEKTGRIKQGDILVAIDGRYCYEMKYRDIVELISSCKRNYMYLRFLRSTIHDLQTRDSDIVDEYFETKTFSKESYRPLPLRSLYMGVYPNRNYNHKYSELSQVSKDNENKIINYKDKWYSEVQKKNDEPQHLGLFDNEIDAAAAYDNLVKELYPDNTYLLNFNEDGSLSFNANLLSKRVTLERQITIERVDNIKDIDIEDCDENGEVDEDGNIIKKIKIKTNNLNYDSDDDKSIEDDIQSYDSRDENSVLDISESEEEEEGSDNEWEPDNDGNWKPSKDFIPDSDGPLGRLLRAVNQTEIAPISYDWSNYMLELGSQKVGTKRLEQIDLATGKVIRLWDNMVQAARVLNIQISLINNCVLEKINSAGSYKWRWGAIYKGIEDVPDEDDMADEDLEPPIANDDWKLKLQTKTKDYRNGGNLRDYQVEGLNWLLRCWYTKTSSILADEMGLGKTVQVVSFLDHLFEVENIKGPFLIVVPLSTIEHWRRETEGWTFMTACVYHDSAGGRDMRDIIREYEWYYKGRSRRLLKFHVIITTYDDLIRDYEELAEIPWRVVVVDEAHRLKGNNSKLADCLRSVVSKGLQAHGYQHRILMTGTPLQNNTAELWSLLNFIEPSRFPDAEKFAERYGDIKTQEQIESLQRRIGPLLLRRVKEDVATDIPPKEETIIDVELTTMQKQYYRAIFERNHGFLMKSLKSNQMPQLMNIQMELRKCCNHPFLIGGIEETEMIAAEESTIEEFGDTDKGKFNEEEFQRKRMKDILIPSSGKMVLVDKLLPKLKKEGHKVLIFSQMVKMIDIIEEYCEYFKYSCERLDGRVSGNERQKAIDRYNKNDDSFVFLLSTRAGGVGINLTAADTVIIFDSDWNPQNDVQAMARCHRIGQKKSVKIYRLITRRSFESEMFQRASKKLGLEQALLGDGKFEQGDIDESIERNKKLDSKELEQLLREGAYAVMMEDDGKEIQEFCEQDIDSILMQRSHTIVTEGAVQTESWLNKRKNKTTKSMFTGDTATEHADVDVNDPDFWKKVLPDLVSF